MIFRRSSIKPALSSPELVRPLRIRRSSRLGAGPSRRPTKSPKGTPSFTWRYLEPSQENETRMFRALVSHEKVVIMVMIIYQIVVLISHCQLDSTKRLLRSVLSFLPILINFSRKNEQREIVRVCYADRLVRCFIFSNKKWVTGASFFWCIFFFALRYRMPYRISPYFVNVVRYVETPYWK